MRTKKDFQEYTKKLLEPLKGLYSEGFAKVDLGGDSVVYGQEAAYFEAFARPLFGLVPLWLGGGSEPFFEAIYPKGLDNGSNPESPEYWGGLSDGNQRFVEMVVIALGMILTPEKIWDPLSEAAKKRLADWLYGINEHRLPECNWQFFKIIVNAALMKRGCRFSQEGMEDALGKIDSYYVGGGWYRDGDSNQKDYYIAFAMHYYGLLYSTFMKKEDSEHCRLFRERATEFAKDFMYWFADDGSAVPYGRSLQYRFAQSAFWSACVFAKLDGVPVEVAKGIIIRNIQWWEKQQILDRDGVLVTGYAYPNQITSEKYNAMGGSYWALKTMICLGLDDEDPFWHVEAAELPSMSSVRAMKDADLVAHRYDGQVCLYPAGVCVLPGLGHYPEKYAKFAYSTRFGFSCARSQMDLTENAPDSMLAFVLENDDYVYVRRRSISYEVREDKVVSVWTPVSGIMVTTQVIPLSDGHMRIHEITSDYDCMAYDCGYSVPTFVAGADQKINKESAWAGCGDLSCLVQGEGPKAQGTIIGADPNTSLLFRNTVIPAISYSIKAGEKICIKTVIKTS